MKQSKALVLRADDLHGDLAAWWDQQAVTSTTPFLHSRIVRLGDSNVVGSERFGIRLLTRSGEPVAGLAMHRQRWRYRTPARVYASPLDVVVVDDDEVHQALPRWLDAMPYAQLYRIPEESPLIDTVATQDRWSVTRELPSPFVDFTALEPWSPSSSNLGKSIRRRRRRLEELGEVTYTDHADPQDLGGELDVALELEVAGWKGREGIAIRQAPNYERWLMGLVDVAQDEGWLRLSSLRLGGEMVSFSLDLVYCERRFSILSAYAESEALARLSPGSLLLDEIIRHAEESGVMSYEFGYGNQPWKYEWTDRERRLFDLRLFGRGAGRLLAGVDRLRRSRQGTAEPTSTD